MSSTREHPTIEVAERPARRWAFLLKPGWLGAILAAHGLGFDDVVKSTVHLQHLKRDFAAYNEAYKSYFTQPFPVRTTVGSELMNILVEIDFDAHKSA